MTVTLRAALVALAVVAGSAASQPPKPDVEAVLYANLRDVINKGVDVYNGGDIAGCYRLFEGALRTVRPLVAHRAALVEEIDGKLAAAEREAVTWRKAFALRAALDKVRSELKPKDADPLTPPVADKKKPEGEEEAKKAEEKRKADEAEAKKREEVKKAIDDLIKREEEKNAAEAKKKLEEAKKKEEKPTEPVKVEGRQLKQPREVVEKPGE